MDAVGVSRRKDEVAEGAQSEGRWSWWHCWSCVGMGE